MTAYSDNKFKVNTELKTDMTSEMKMACIFHVMYQLHALTMILQSLYSDMFQHDNAIFREKTPHLKPIKVNYTTFINFSL
jgi:hypothetical protein